MDNKIKKITSVSNDLIKYFLSLNDKKTRNKEKKFIIEGYHLLEEVSKTTYLRSVISTDEKVLNKFENVNKYLVTDAIIEKLSTTKNPQNILGIVDMLDHDIKNLDKILKETKVKILMLDEINDPGNLGTIIRTAGALGANAIIVSNNTVDIYNEKVIRATQGVIFKLSIIKCDLNLAIKKLKDNHVKCFGTSLQKATDLSKVESLDRFCLCLGNEARGMNKDLLNLMDENIKIDMKNDVESLNVAIASAIIFYQLQK